MYKKELPQSRLQKRNQPLQLARSQPLQPARSQPLPPTSSQPLYPTRSQPQQPTRSQPLQPTKEGFLTVWFEPETKSSSGIMYARCLFPFFLLIVIAGRNLILSDDRVYPTSTRLTKFEQLNRRTRYKHLRSKDTRRKMTKREIIWPTAWEETKEENVIYLERVDEW
ncbi:hypothetical protein V1264_005148 [Littorina saxatilis]|uniref:Uncharacterized protein n=1 Tax=Littorina saxatilis TaxID=31220 RepID=A0AAN9AYM8_9CAEN